MVRKEVALEVAAFLDSSEARGLPSSPTDVRQVTEAFLTLCYDELGKKPRLLDHEDVSRALVEALPARFGPRDPLAEQVPDVLRAYLDHLESTQVVPQAFEIRRALEESSEAFLECVRSGRNAERQVRPPQKPFVHQASKLGRNDPCSCGSGRKYKKCHGKEA